MGTINLVTIGPDGQPNASGPVDSNFQTVQTVINGNLDDSNISSVGPGKLTPGGATEGQMLAQLSGNWTPQDYTPQTLGQGGATEGQILTNQSGVWTPANNVDKIATTVAGLGTPLDGQQAAVLAGGSDLVPLVYSATLGDWVSPHIALVSTGTIANTNQNGAPQTLTYTGGGIDRTSESMHLFRIFDTAGLRPQFRTFLSVQRDIAGASNIIGQTLVQTQDHDTDDRTAGVLTGTATSDLTGGSGFPALVANSGWTSPSLTVKDLMIVFPMVTADFNQGQVYNVQTHIRWISK